MKDSTESFARFFDFTIILSSSISFLPVKWGGNPRSAHSFFIQVGMGLAASNLDQNLRK
jgi:hypothetical protein